MTWKTLQIQTSGLNLYRKQRARKLIRYLSYRKSRIRKRSLCPTSRMLEFSDIDNSSSDEITEENIRLLFKQYKELGGITGRQQMEYETIFRQVPDPIDEYSDCPDDDSIDEICEFRPPMEVIPDHSRRFGDPVARRMDFLLNRSAPYPGDDLDTILRPIFGGERFYCHRSDDPEFYSINDTLYQLVEDRLGILIH
ncbi:hypothetical protein K435DRAFT_849910 [Dendrothele bispora CBS 962.96]|uniref:Uncharacterized protein n=1 Tax=Dendrothele bispora (strain CBS 962.96) TaxID=1314807 RepID=A0A4S8MQK3_DENBC|nr:hypothetical protein K435DRAFT_849910 [Dendrothele bispora CBS 962.96]